MDVNKVLKCIGLEPKKFLEQKEWKILLATTYTQFIYDTVPKQSQIKCKLIIILFYLKKLKLKNRKIKKNLKKR